MRRRFLILATCFFLLVPLAVARIPAPRGALARTTPPLGSVQAIKRGLSVTRPHGHSEKGRVHQSLGNQYELQTKTKQRASLRFRDRTLLHMNQNTDLVLNSPHITYVKGGEVDEVLAPGGNHRIQTAGAVASAIGTNFDIRVKKRVSTFVVVEGSLVVKDKMGSVVVKTNQQTTVSPGKAPTPPVPADGQASVAWTTDLPASGMGQNIALDANGGQILTSSSQDLDSRGDVTYINDGTLTNGWLSAPGKTADQSVIFGFAQYPVGTNSPPVLDSTYTIAGVLIDPAATEHAADTNDLKDFEIRVSTTGIADTDFTTVFRGMCRHQNALQSFALPAGIRARFLQLVVRSNYGGPDHIAVAELEVVGTPSPGGAETQNLVANGNAESGSGAPDDGTVVAVPNWNVTGKFTAVQYGAAGGFPLPTDPGPPDRAKNFFAGGPEIDTSAASQSIDLSSRAAEIDGGKDDYLLSAYLGGYTSQEDNAVLTATFEDAAGATLATTTLGPVTAEDRTFVTGLVPRATSGPVPSGTRTVLLTLVMTRTDGSYDDGSADDISLKLIAPG